MQKVKTGVVAILLLTLSSCEIVGDIFQAGVGVGMFIVVAVIILVLFVVVKMFGGKK